MKVSASEKVANNNISGFGMSSFSDQVKYKDFDIFDSSLGRLVPSCDKSMSSLLGKKPVDGLRLTQPVWSKTENLLRSASQVLGTAEHFLAATGHLLNSEDSVVPAEVRSFLLQLDKALGSSQLLLMGSIANCTLSKRAEFLENISIAEPLKDSLLKSPLSDKMFGLPLQRVQEELSKTLLQSKLMYKLLMARGRLMLHLVLIVLLLQVVLLLLLRKGRITTANRRTNPITQEKAQVSLLVVLRVPRNLGLVPRFLPPRTLLTASPGENLQQVPQKSIPVGGRLSFFLNQWKKITSDCYVLSIIRGGLTLQFKNPPPLSAVPISLSHTQDPVKCQLLSVEVDTMLQKAAIEEVSILTLSPGFYSRLFLVPKKTGGMRPVIDLSILNKFLIVPHFKMETNRSIRASILPGMWTTSLDLSDAYFHIPISKTYRKYLRRLEQQNFPVQGSPFWPVYSPFGFYQNHAGSYSSPTFPVYSDSFLSGRFPSQGILPNQIEGSDRLGHQLFSVPRLPYLLEKVRDNSVSRLCFPGRTFPNQCRPSPPTRGEIYKTMSENTFIPDGSISHSTSILATSGSIELSGRCNSIGTTSHSSASVLSAQVMDCSFTRMGSIDSNHSAFISTPSMVKIAGENCKIIVIAPAWPKQSWFPDLLRLSCACPLVLPLRPDLLSQIKGKVLYQNPEKLHLHAWLLSGLASEREVFLKEQPSISQSLSETPLALSMMQNGQSSQIGVDKTSVTLLTDPAFLAKNQIPDKGAEPVVIPALLAILFLTCSLRSVSNSRLFIPIKKGISDLSVKTISTWICKCISLAYGSSKAELLNSFNVKAHDVRGISTSWALFNSASLEEVLSAGFWRNENSFISHYLQSMATFAESLYSLGPIVSAQRLNFPPVSSVTGDSALR
ncbi:unnamed protein product [Mytilus edulis]|uniref:Reverse transcriptase domain-containing protein n=1 Tax=Mytilus edulis TaxID=6550 RepID=A0A8S3SND9_MYTED|nr:unnamed protein product [Mytilus edulis]